MFCHQITGHNTASFSARTFPLSLGHCFRQFSVNLKFKLNNSTKNYRLSWTTPIVLSCVNMFTVKSYWNNDRSLSVFLCIILQHKMQDLKYIGLARGGATSTAMAVPVQQWYGHEYDWPYQILNSLTLNDVSGYLCYSLLVGCYSLSGYKWLLNIK